MGFSDEDIRKVREATDLVALIGERIVLKPRNRDFWGNCPFHNEKTPSFKVDPTSQFYHCFGCGESGDAITFLRKTDGLDFADAVRYLAERANIELHETGAVQSGRKARLFKVMDKTVAFYHQQLMRTKTPATDTARDYLARRGMGGAVARDWQLGYAPGHQALSRELNAAGFSRDDLLETNVALKGRDGLLRDRFYERVIFPINDLQGRPIALGGRILANGEPKYLNTSDTALFSKGTTLYALDRAKAQITASGAAIVVEGYTDTIAMHTAGFTNTVATLGTALTNDHIKMLARFARRLVYLFDGDAAGQRAADRAASLITREITPESSSRPVELLVALLPAGLDPADFLAADTTGSHNKTGAAAMQELIATAEPLLRFTIDRRLAAYDLRKPEQRQLALAEGLKVLLPIRGSMLATDYLNYLADALGVNYETVADSFKRLKEPRQPMHREQTREQTAQQTPPMRATREAQQERQTQQVQPLAPTQAPGQALERELLSYYLQCPELREKMRVPFSRIQWQDELNQSVAELLLQADIQASSAQLTAQLLDTYPQSAEILTAARDIGNAEKAYQQILIVSYSLRIKQAEREIRNKRAEFGKLDTDSSNYDELFREIKQRQDELVELRRHFSEVSVS